MDRDHAIDHYYQLRAKHRRPIPRKLSAAHKADDAAAMETFLQWCQGKDIDDPAGYMAERFRSVYLASRRKAVPRITQLANDMLAKRWTGWIEGERIAATSYTKRVAQDDQFALVVKSLAAAPHVTKESFKRRLAGEGAEACMTMVHESGGYHPKSGWCQQCACAVRCAARVNEEHGFDVVALRSGALDKVPARVASALVR
jgi:hypothetical protein